MDRQWCNDRNLRLFGTPQPVAFVTGSSSDRVGRRIAQLLLQCQFRVAFHGHRQNAEHVDFVHSLRVDGHDTLCLHGDLRETSNASLWMKQILERWNRVDLLVNSAAIWEPAAFTDTTSELLRQHWEINVLGSFMTAQQFGLAMSKQESGGAIVNIGDWATSRPYANFSAYFLSKGCVETMTRTLAVELAAKNPRIRVNAILPGPVLMAEGIAEPQQKRIAEDCLLKRAGAANDIAEAVYFLATSPFITGVSLPIDGGRSISSGHGLDSVAHPSMNA